LGLELEWRGSTLPVRLPRSETLQARRISVEPVPKELGVEVEIGSAEVRREEKEEVGRNRFRDDQRNVLFGRFVKTLRRRRDV
jgi:hypothetical protein